MKFDLKLVSVSTTFFDKKNSVPFQFEGKV